MMKKYLLIALFGLFSFGLSAQILSNKAEISLWTYEPIADMYGAYGHNAVRVFDPVRNINYIYNYGTFDFDEPYFLAKFVRGRLNYKLSVVRPTNNKAYNYFLNYLKNSNRTILETPLLLDSTARQKYFDLLETNSKPENAFYLYDFFFDNCATRIRDILVIAAGDQIDFDANYIEKPLSFRDLHKQYMGGRDWTNFGIDIIFGIKSDQIATPEERVYLPRELKLAFENASITTNGKKQPLTGEDRIIVKSPPVELKSNFWLSPLFLIWLFFGGVLIYTILTYQKTPRFWFDKFWFLLTGIAGLIVFFMWFGTDHKVTVDNLNLLWLHPFHLVAGIALYSAKARAGWLKKYFKIIFILTALTLASIPILPQYFNPAFIPMMLIFMLRSYQLFR